MKSKILLIPLALLALTITVPVRAEPAWFVECQLELTDFIYVETVPGGILFDVPFEGVAGGPNVKEGTVVGVDHVLIDGEGNAHLNIYLTITDKEGDAISAHITGLAVPKNPGQLVFEGAWATIINEFDPTTDVFYPTTGKYIDLLGETFRDEGFLTEVSVDPPGGYVHVKWYLD